MTKNKFVWWQNLTPYKIVLASDHAGFELKTALKKWLATTPLQVVDVGTHSTVSVDYPLIIHQATQVFQNHQAQFAILICGSGIGVNMIANRYSFWRAYRYCSGDQKGVLLARQHNDANVLTFGGRLLTLIEAQTAIIAFLTTAFSQEPRHAKRLQMFASFKNCC